MKTHGTVGFRSKIYSFVAALTVFIGIGAVFVCCVSCVRSSSYLPPRSRISLSDINVNRAMNATVAFVQQAPISMTTNPPAQEGESPWLGPYCTGFFIDDTHIVSAAHCFQHVMVLQVMPGVIVHTIPSPLHETAYFVQHGEIQWRGTVTGEPTSAEVTLWDEHNDVVILTVTEEDFHPNAFLTLSETVPSHGDEVFHIGHPRAVAWTLFPGIISNRVRTDDVDPDMVSTLQIDLPVSPGCSGGPLVDSNGEVVGLVNAFFGTGSNIGIARSVSVISRLVEAE